MKNCLAITWQKETNSVAVMVFYVLKIRKHVNFSTKIKKIIMFNFIYNIPYVYTTIKPQCNQATYKNYRLNGGIIFFKMMLG